MANENELPDDLLAAQQQLNRQQKMAELLMSQNQQPQGQMISGRYVAPAWTQQLAPVVNMLAGAYLANKGDEKSLALAKQIREGKAAANQEIIKDVTGYDKSTELAGPYAGNVPMPTAVQRVEPNLSEALRKIDTNQFGAGKELKPMILEQLAPKLTPEQIRYKAAIADGSWNPEKMGGFNAFMNQMTEKDKAQLRLENLKYGLEKQRFDADYAPYNPAAFGQPAAQPMPQNAPQVAPAAVGTPVIKPTGLAPNAPAYAQGALNLPATQTGQVNPQMPQANVQANPQANPQALPTPPAWVRTQKDYKDWLKSESEPLNEFQGKAVLYGSGMVQANNVINQLATEGTTKGAVVPNFLSGIAALAPLGVGDAAVNAIQAAFRADPTGLVGPDKNQQKLAQAQLGFAIPYLRQTSGANFGAKEVADTIAEFFPLRGESDEVAKQKEASRNRVIQGMKAVAGRGARQIDALGSITSAPTSGWGKAQVVTQ
jgi:hypothetical protein